MLHLLSRIPWLFICTAALKKVRALAGGIACFDRELPVGKLLVFVAVCEGWIPSVVLWPAAVRGILF